MFPEGFSRGAISCVERKRVPEGWGILPGSFRTKRRRIKKNWDARSSIFFWMRCADALFH